jgi:hypothetical protein
MSAETTIVCDVCARIITASRRGAADARHELRELGGATLGGRDYCAECLRLRADDGGLLERDLTAALANISGKLTIHALELARDHIAGARARRRDLAVEWATRRGPEAISSRAETAAPSHVLGDFA